MKKKRVGYGNFYCRNCGKRMIKGKKSCPHCGVVYSGSRRFAKEDLLLHPHVSLHHRSFRRYLFRSLSCYLTWMVGSVLVIPLIIWAWDWGEVSFSYIYQVVMPWLTLFLWSFWGIWIFLQMRGSTKHRKAVWKRNRETDGELICAECGGQADRRDNFCGRCGCILLK